MKADRSPYSGVVRLVRSHRSFLLTTHMNPDGDGLGAQSALYLALRRLGKRVAVVNHDPLPPRYAFLPFARAYRTSDRIPPHELCFVLDAGNFQRIREGVRRSEFGTLVNIDHHYSNDLFGDHNLVLPEAAATGEIVLHLVEALGVRIDRDIAESVYTSLLTDTGGFRYSNTNARVLRLAARLLECGARSQWVSERVFSGYTPEAMELVRSSLGSLRTYQEGRLATLTLSRAQFKRSGAREEDTENLINYVRKLGTVEVAAFLKERADGRIKISLRSKTRLNVARLASRWGGGGHAYSAGAVLPGPLPKALRSVVSTCRKALA